MTDTSLSDLDALALVARAAADKAVREVIGATQKPATVLAYADNVAKVHVDGDPDDVTVDAESLVTPAPYANARVMVQFHPPNAVFVSGWIGRPDPAGKVDWFGTDLAPDGWLACDGSAVSRSDYPALFEAIGTRFGAGDGTTTFTLPQSDGRVPMGSGALAVGSVGGAASVTLTTAQVPGHSHYIGSHGHSIGSHSHDLGSHSHSIASHGHSFSGSSGSDGYHSHLGQYGDLVQAGTSGAGAGVTTTGEGYVKGGIQFAGTHSHSVSGSVGSTSLGTGYTDIGTTGEWGLNTLATNIGSTGSTGGGGSHENRPPFIAFLCCISY